MATLNPEKASILERTHTLVEEYASSFPTHLVTVKPDSVAFSATEIVWHLRAVEELWHKRFGQMKAEDEPTFFVAMKPDEVAKNEHHNERSLREGLSSWATLRKQTLQFLESLGEKATLLRGMHERYGAMDIPRILDIMINHDLQHLEQLKRTYKQVEDHS